MHSSRLRALYVVLALASAPLLQGCVELAIATGATVGVAAMQERGVTGTAKDQAIRAEINHLWLQKDHRYFGDLNLQVQEGRVLVSGTVKDAETRAEAIQLVWQAENVREVINEVEVTDVSGGVVGYGRDTAINTELRTRLLFAKNVDSVNYSIETVHGNVYLLGVAQNQQELDRVLEIARNVSNVRRVVSHVLLKDDPRRLAKAPES